jgi:hypothetical protein
MTRRVVWKFAIPLGTHAGVTTFQIPEGARFLHCAEQYGAMCMWFEVLVGETRTVQRGFRIFGTGDETIDDHLSYVGTGHFNGGTYVFHVYEVSYG